MQKILKKLQHIPKKIVLLGITITILIFVIINNIKETNKNINYIKYDQNLAGEKVPFDNLHYYNKERLDRELAFNLMNEAQIMIIWKRLSLLKPKIIKKLKAANIPEDIFYLAVAESALRETAVSNAGAAGIRQFMPKTAKGYNLKVDTNIDERFNTEKATDAAIQYLQNAYKVFGNWTLAMASYNRGISGIKSDLKNQYQDNYYDLLLNNETQRYIFRIIALKEILENINQYFDTNKRGKQYKKPKTEKIILGKTDDIALRAKQHGYTYAEIKILNPRIRSNKLPSGNRKIKTYKRNI